MPCFLHYDNTTKVFRKVIATSMRYRKKAYRKYTCYLKLLLALTKFTCRCIEKVTALTYKSN